LYLADDVENGVWKTALGEYSEWGLSYVKELAKGGKFKI